MARHLLFHDSQYPQAVHSGLVAALRAGRVPGRFLYDSPGQAARWLAYHAAWSPSRTLDELSGLYQTAFEAVWAQQAQPELTLVGVGCGGGRKDATFLGCGPHQAGLRYVPADTSAALVLEASAGAERARPDTTLLPIVVDLQAEPSRADFLQGDLRRPAVWSCLGLLPNLDADWLLPYVARLMAPQDHLLVSANLSPGPHHDARDLIVPQYDNPEARAWYQGALDELGLGANDATLCMSDRALGPNGESWRIECHAVIERACAVKVFAESVPLHAGARLEVFHSDRYVPEVLPNLLAQHGLHCTQHWVTTDRQEGIYLCRLSPDSSRR